MAESLRIAPLPHGLAGDLAVLIATAFHEYPPFRFVHQHLSGGAYRAALTSTFRYYIELTWLVDDPVFGAWVRGRLVGGMIMHTPETPGWTDAQEELTREFGAGIDAGAFKRLLAFESMMAGNEPQLDVPYHYIDLIAVHPDCQGKGYARVLVNHAVELSRRHPTSGAVCLSTEAESNHGLYRKLGFEQVSVARLDEITSTSFKLMTPPGKP